VGEAIAENAPTSQGGAVTSYTVDPPLPVGLSLDPLTGVISSTPTAVTAQATYVVTASNSGGSATADLVITVNDVAPSELAYGTNPATYTKGQAIAQNVPTNLGGEVVSYSVDPALPGGLSLDSLTGVISGTPAAITATANYAVTAQNSGGSTTADLVITVNDAPPANLAYGNNPAVYARGTQITPNEPTSSGGAVVSYSVSPALPGGLNLDPVTGVITGTPSTEGAQATYVVMATNTGGSTQVDLAITVEDPCGNGQTDPGEECDDGNVADGDGCGHSCLVEGCGDGLTQLALGESCDDANTADGDGCDASCHVEPFETTDPVKISGDLSCTTAVANAARKISVDGSGTIYAVMMCGSAADVAVSADRGQTFSGPTDLSNDLPDAPVAVSQVAVAAGPSGVAYVAIMLDTGAVYLRTTEDSGATWGDPLLIGSATSTSSGLSLQSFNDDVYVGFSTSGGVAVARNHSRGTGTFDITSVGISIAFFDLVYDVTLETLAVCADTPTFHVRASSDGGATFDSEVNPPGTEYYSDWAIGNGNIFVSGVNLGSSGGAADLYVIPTDALSTSTLVTGLPVVSTAQSRSVSADAAGNAFVASQLNGGGVQLDRLAAGASSFDTPRLIDATGGSPIAAPLPGNGGAAVVYTVGSEVFATVQAY
jgi:cysteine-rich repeat protein